jgi:hypothetical protein
MTQELMIQDNGMIARAEIDVMISTAKAYPRDVKQAISEAEVLATIDEETAQSCFYVLPRKDKDGVKIEIKGPSIRLAEIMISSWGNIHAATRIVENDGRHITAEGVCWDLEKNVKSAMQNKVSIIFGQKGGKGGYTANADMQTMLSNAASAKALRNAIFKVIPKALVNRIYEKAMVASVGDTKSSSLLVKVKEVFDKLAKMGIDKEMILEYYERPTLNDITADDLRSLIGVGTAIKDKMISVDDVFQIQKEENVSASDHVNALLAEKAKPRLSHQVEVQTTELR